MLDQIRVIVSDFDGTLLDDEKRLPEGFPALLDALEQRNIRFIAASGRQYYNIRAQLPDDMADRVDYIAENGAMTVRNNEICWVDEMPAADVTEIVQTIRQTEGAYPILCGAQCAYFENGDIEEMLFHAGLYYARLKLVPDVLEAISDDAICKIAVFHNHDAEHVSYPALLPYSDRMQVALSGDCWVDVMNKSVSKGAALQELLRRMDIAPEHCMAFGDYLNDMELLEVSGHPYVMENAHPQLLERFPNTSGHNNHGGVVTTICRELGIEV